MPVMQMLLVGHVPLDASATPTSINESVSTRGVIEGGVSIIVTGGTGNYTYNTTWANGGALISIVNPTTANPGVSSNYTGLPPTIRSGTLNVAVSDGVATVNVMVPVELSWT